MIYCKECNSFYFEFTFDIYQLQFTNVSPYVPTTKFKESVKCTPLYDKNNNLLLYSYSDIINNLSFLNIVYFKCPKQHKLILDNYIQQQLDYRVISELLLNKQMSEYNFIMSLISDNKIDLNTITIEQAFKLHCMLNKFKR